MTRNELRLTNSASESDFYAIYPIKVGDYWYIGYNDNDYRGLDEYISKEVVLSVNVVPSMSKKAGAYVMHRLTISTITPEIKTNLRYDWKEQCESAIEYILSRAEQDRQTYKRL